MIGGRKRLQETTEVTEKVRAKIVELRTVHGLSLKRLAERFGMDMVRIRTILEEENVWGVHQ
jgi:ribosome-binding protein aMBF1 (putative translation factor)